MRKWMAKIGVLAAAGLAAAPRALAQGCAMCYLDANAQSPRAKHMLDLAILSLLIPSVLMFGGVLMAAFRRRVRDEQRESAARDIAPREKRRGLASDSI